MPLGAWTDCRRFVTYRPRWMDASSPAAAIARSPAAWERLAKEWLVEVIERTPLQDLEGLPLAWIAQEAPPLIAEILGQLTDPGAQHELELSPAARERAASLAAERLAGAGPGRLPRELAALQSVLIEALRNASPARDRHEFARAVGRLAEVFGAVQSAAVESLVRERGAGAAPDPRTGLAGAAELHEWLRILLMEHRRTGRPFALGHVELEGVERITSGYGEDARERIVKAVAALAEGQLAGQERAFRLGEGQLVVVAPDDEPARLLEFGGRLAELVERSQSPGGPRIGTAVGVAAVPGHEASPDGLLASAEEAAWAARASGQPVALARSDSLQDR
jgi:GGDEF domain-containing protein